MTTPESRLSYEETKNLSQQEALDLIHPKRSYTEAEHVEAWYKYILYELQEEQLASLWYDIGWGKTTWDPEKKKHLVDEDGKLLRTPMTTEDIKKELEALIFPDEEDEEDKERPWYERRINTYWVRDFRTIAESGQHCGDCTGIPASCARCFVDEFYGVNTVTWNGKSAGSSLLWKAHPQKS